MAIKAQERVIVERRGTVLDPNLDGVTHINVYSGANTRLGRELSNMSGHGFFVKTLYEKIGADGQVTKVPHGRFNTLEGYWWWLSTGMTDDYFRTCSGFDARKKGLKMPRVTRTQFKHEIRKAIALKLKAHPEILKRLLSSTLPLTHYYVYGRNLANPMVRPADSSFWVIEFLQGIRATGGEILNQVLT